MSYYNSAAAAEGAGFRPCKRCQPDQMAPVGPAARIAKACRLIEAADTPLPLPALAEAIDVSPSHFHRQFKAALGITPNAYASALRERRARSALTRGATVTEALYEAGYSSSGRFYATASKVFGMSPSSFRAGGTDEVIAHTVCPCTLGHVLVAASHKGVCAIYLGDEADALRAALKEQFPHARHEDAPPDFAKTIAVVAALVDAPGAPCTLPLDIRGTAFQRRVWDALLRVPAGSTVSYAELAAAIGAPTAARAVAGACAANQIAVAIPCHRVVRLDGAISGYRWGTGRKCALLAKERAEDADNALAPKHAQDPRS